MEHIHDYKYIRETKDGILEICKECKKKLVTRKDPQNGRIDNKKYIKEHTRSTAQPYGKTSKIFKKYYAEVAEVVSRYK